MSVVENGSLTGCTFEDYISRDRVKVLGARLADINRFPLLVKIISAKDNLSVQVHPCDRYVQGERDSGKSEMWYVLRPPDNGYLVVGLKPGVTREMLRAACRSGAVEDCLNRLHVGVGDIIDIPSGVVHALTAGAVVAEVQQNSDITYRLYDWGRAGADGKPRPLHVDDALAVADFGKQVPLPRSSKATPCRGSQAIDVLKKSENDMNLVISNPHFTIEKYVISSPYAEESDIGAFSIFTCVDGDALISTAAMSVEIPQGRSVFIPAGMGAYTIAPSSSGNAVLLKSKP